MKTLDFKRLSKSEVWRIAEKVSERKYGKIKSLWKLCNWKWKWNMKLQRKWKSYRWLDIFGINIWSDLKSVAQEFMTIDQLKSMRKWISGRIADNKIGSFIIRLWLFIVSKKKLPTTNKKCFWITIKSTQKKDTKHSEATLNCNFEKTRIWLWSCLRRRKKFVS